MSVGETISAVPTIEKFLDVYPSERVLVTTTTPTGSREVLKRLGNRVHHCYVPLDLIGCVKRFLKRTRPKILLLWETELWPNLIKECARADIPVYVLNARLSSESARRYQRFRGIVEPMLDQISGIACQYEDSASRFRELGACTDRLHVIGNVKFDLEQPPKPHLASSLIHYCERREFVWIAGSTHSPEENIVLDAHHRIQKKFDPIGLIIAPRHVTRADEVIAMCRQMDLHSCLLSDFTEDAEVIVVDSIGWLFSLYRYASVAFVGGSLQDSGGHNPIEPAFHGVPILMGPNRKNFEEICRRFEEQDCLVEVTDAVNLAAAIVELMGDPHELSIRSERTRETVVNNRGARVRLQELVQDWVSTLN